MCSADHCIQLITPRPLPPPLPCQVASLEAEKEALRQQLQGAQICRDVALKLSEHDTQRLVEAAAKEACLERQLLAMRATESKVPGEQVSGNASGQPWLPCIQSVLLLSPPPLLPARCTQRTPEAPLRRI